MFLKLKTLVKQFLEKILDLIFPKSKKVISLEELSITDWQKASSFWSSKNFMSAFSYQNSNVQDAIWEIKYRRNEKLLNILSIILAESLLVELSDRSQFENFTEPIIVPIPLSKDRDRTEGFHHTLALSQTVGEHLALPVHDILIKVKETPRLAKLSKRQREEVLQNAFNVHDGASVEGKNIIVVDDITTTGSTFREARRALLDRGAKKVLFVSLARA